MTKIENHEPDNLRCYETLQTHDKQTKRTMRCGAGEEGEWFLKGVREGRDQTVGGGLLMRGRESGGGEAPCEGSRWGGAVRPSVPVQPTSMLVLHACNLSHTHICF